MTLAPGYGETPVPDDELEALLPHARQLLEEPVTKAAIYDLEQAVQVQVTEVHLASVLDGGRRLENLLDDHYVRELHKQLYGDIWAWAGVLRKHELNIGVDPWQIAVQLRDSLQTIRYRWEHTEDWSPRQVGIAVHAETVRIHPFTDGNGRSTRLLADLAFVAAQLAAGCSTTDLAVYDWDIDKSEYIALLRRYDGHRDPTELAAFIPVQAFADQ
jgi:fido (protein-threonine AMPylation protein)